MATTPISYNSYNPTSQYNYTNPRNAAISGQQSIASQGQQLYDQNNQSQDQNNTAAQGTQSYLGSIEDPLAQGQGGYNASEQSQIELTPQQQQDIVTGAGISAGANTTAATDAATRAFNATGGNPAALATYRSREAQQQGAQAGQAMTQARIGAQQAGAAGAEAVGNAQIGQQDQALSYYNGLQTEQNTNAQSAANRNQQTYGTATGGTNGATANAINASQTPTTADKVIGAVSGFLEDGGEAMGHEAVVGEGNNPERIVSSNYSSMSSQGQPGMMEDGGDAGDSGWVDASGAMPVPDAGSSPSWWQKLSQTLKSNAGTSPQPVSSTGNMGGGGMGSGMGSGGQKWNPATPYQQLGSGLGKLALGFGLEDGGIMPSFEQDGGSVPPAYRPQGTNGIFTRPTRVNLQPGDKVVPLTHRPYAKVRPSAAFGESGVR